jgi:tetratricopeptide (TPR) repeat protein
MEPGMNRVYDHQTIPEATPMSEPIPTVPAAAPPVDTQTADPAITARGPDTATAEYPHGGEAGVVIAGRYTLLERIGEGGMGEVWVAKQTEPVQRKVAVKLVKVGMDSKAVLARFEVERQALALMDHPNIARVLDGGLTEKGRPYFVMELVNGLPLTRFCDEAKLTPRERLELFVPVCQAVQHAHQKGVVHRDLKPSNILVTLYDGRPVPKIIDFVVAKAIGGRLTDATLSTQFGAVLGTLEYMAPEQAGFSALDVDTRADVYSLGVILYEQLSGLRPFDSTRIHKAAIDEVLRIIREEDPPRPSTRLSTDDALPSLAAVRRTEPRRLTALMRGELDWVVMKCLEKDRGRRYETANGLARDLQRFLADEPVEARPPSAGYRARKFVRRNRGPALAATLVALALVGGVVGTTWGMIRAAAARDAEARQRAEADENFRLARSAVDEYFTAVSESTLLDVPGLQPLRKDLLERALRYYTEFARRHEADPALRAELAAAYYRAAVINNLVGSQSEAVTNYGRALACYEGLVQASPDQVKFRTDLAICASGYGNLLRVTGRSDEAMRLERQAFTAREALAAAHPGGARFQSELAKSHASIGRLLSDAGRVEDSLRSFEASLAITSRLAAAPAVDLTFETDLGKGYSSDRAFRADLAWDCLRVSYAQFASGRYADALQSRAKGRDIATRLDAEHPGRDDIQTLLASCHTDEAVALNTLGRPAEALEAFRRGLVILERLSAANPAVGAYQKHQAETHLNVANTLSRLGRYAEALDSLAAARRLLVPLLAAQPALTWPRYVLSRTELQQAYTLYLTGAPLDEVIRHLEAARAQAEALVAMDRTVVDFRVQLAGAHTQLGWHLAAAGRKDAAWDARQAARAVQEELVAASQAVTLKSDLSETYNQLGRLALDLNRPAEADDYVRKALDIRERLARDYPSVDDYQSGLAYVFRSVCMVETAAGRTAEAREAIRRARAIDERLVAKYPLNAYNLACSIALEMKAVAKGPAGPDREATQRRLADEAMAALRSAADKGYGRLSQYEDEDFAQFLRSRADYQALLAEKRAKEKLARPGPAPELAPPPRPAR